MPMRDGEYQKVGTEVEPQGEQTGSVRQKVEDFLRENAGKAWSTKEIAEELDLVRATVNQSCLKLAEKGRTRRMSVDGTIYNCWNPDGKVPESLDPSGE